MDDLDVKEEAVDTKKEQKEKRKSMIGWGIYIVVLLGLLITFRFFLMIGKIPSESMEPTLMVHDWTIADRRAFVDADENDDDTPKRGDILIFYQADEDETMVKRVIGLPGETVSFVGGKVYIDGKPLDESAYLDDSVKTECDETFTVPEGSYFMLGDNREISLDSRYWDDPFITLDDIKSKVMYVIPFHNLPWFKYSWFS